MLYANVNGSKALPTKGLRGVCPSCGEIVIAKCGPLVTHHWAHNAGSECDPWAEKIGHWHLSWQKLIDVESVEVVRAPHRADIVGNDDVVIELQHSPISAEDIAGRERFYGDMVWLFDATERFELINTGKRTFFSLQRTKHIPLCTKPVFFDFGGIIVEVESFTEVMPYLSGFGRTRTPEWFVEHFLSQKLRSGVSIPPRGMEGTRWSKHHRFDILDHASRWIDPETGNTVVIPKSAVAIQLNWYSPQKSGPNIFEWERLIEKHPRIANGWTKEELLATQSFLRGKIMLIDGYLRVMPSLPGEIPVEMTIAAAHVQFGRVESHIAAGRVPILREETMALLLEKARQYEERRFGGVRTPQKPDPQQTLFQ